LQNFIQGTPVPALPLLKKIYIEALFASKNVNNGGSCTFADFVDRKEKVAKNAPNQRKEGLQASIFPELRRIRGNERIWPLVELAKQVSW